MSRPSDHIDSLPVDPIAAPHLTASGWLRWGWRQLTSMRTALLLLLALAVAAVPGSLVPQTTSDPNGVTQWRDSNPALVPFADVLQLHDVYTSVWFSAIYLLLFVSLVGCVLPRSVHHLRALRTPPPRTPARLSRLPAHRANQLPGTAADAVATAERLLRARRYRTVRYGDSVSAERGYLRETGNLVFHLALVGILAAVFVANGYGYGGQRVLVTGETFVNTPNGYDFLGEGRYFEPARLEPYAVTLNALAVEYEQQNPAAFGQPLDYTATVGVRQPDGSRTTGTVKVNQPLDVAGTSVYLLGNGYAPRITVRDAAGEVLFEQAVPFLPQDATLTSLGVVKVKNLPKGQQVGLLGFFYPTVATLDTGAYTSLYPDLSDPLLTLNVYRGDLETGQPANEYALDTDPLEVLASRDGPAEPLELRPGQTAQLPDGLGTVTLGDVPRFASFDIRHDPTQNWVLVFAVLVVGGLLASLLVPRRRVWVAVTGRTEEGVRVEYGGLARGDDPGLDNAVADIADEHARLLGAPASVGTAVPEQV